MHGIGPAILVSLEQILDYLNVLSLAYVGVLTWLLQFEGNVWAGRTIVIFIII